MKFRIDKTKSFYKFLEKHKMHFLKSQLRKCGIKKVKIKSYDFINNKFNLNVPVSYTNKTLKEIYTYAREFKIPYYSQMNKKELSLAVIRAQAEKQGFFYMEGILDITHQDGYGFLRPINYGPSAEDIYISSSQYREKQAAGTEGNSQT